MSTEELIVLLTAPLAGTIAGFYFSRAPVLSGRLAAFFSLMPYLGLVLGAAFC